MAASTLHMLAPCMLVLLSDVQAQSSLASSASAGDISEVNITITTDICSEDEYSNDCWYPVSCKGCLARTGCAIEVSTGHCVASSTSTTSDVASSSLSSASYFLSGETEYCSGIDPACFTCRRGKAPAVCLGSSGCVCVSQCERISTQATKCLPSSVGGLSSASLIAAAAVILPLVTFFIFKGSPCSLGCSWRRKKAKNLRSLPGSLKLDAWRTHLNERADPVDDRFADLELRSCFVPMNSTLGESRRQQGGAETGDVHVEAGADDVSRAVAATDLPPSPTAHRHAAADAGAAEQRGTAVELV
ncbi:unnamed protein product [Phytophthora fragariaefolia]|uniref:Unnamed protein product n=1 Tax=Phytophthora fragariaefolia TaxID=1490495 RepID=A0A9W6XQ37_9STRA|nr:unnamed protein product [Phytophthora fragariaefolia]